MPRGNLSQPIRARKTGLAFQVWFDSELAKLGLTNEAAAVAFGLLAKYAGDFYRTIRRRRFITRPLAKQIEAAWPHLRVPEHVIRGGAE